MKLISCSLCSVWVSCEPGSLWLPLSHRSLLDRCWISPKYLLLLHLLCHLLLLVLAHFYNVRNAKKKGEDNEPLICLHQHYRNWREILTQLLKKCLSFPLPSSDISPRALKVSVHLQSIHIHCLY